MAPSVRRSFLSFVLRHGDLLAVSRGMKRRQKAVQTLKLRRRDDNDAGVREVRAEILAQHMRETSDDTVHCALTFSLFRSTDLCII